jgi:hypothetical protein
MSKRLRRLWDEFKALLNSNTAWLAAFGEVCLASIEHALELDLPVVAATEFLVCSVKLLLEYEFLNREPVVKQLVSEFQAVLHRGGKPMPAAVAPVPAVPATCVSSRGDRGICCTAVTQLGIQRAAQGFQYTDCNGRTRCLACGTKASVSKKHPGQTVFDVRRVSCGPSGCPALGTVQGQIVQPV